MMQIPNALFVYGTLRPGGSHPMAKLLAKHTLSIVPARFQGRLYQIADYPGAVGSGNPADQVMGEVCVLRDAEALFARLDIYEECSAKDPYPQAYARMLTTVTALRDAAILPVWMYLYTHPIAQHRQILSGDFMHPNI